MHKYYLKNKKHWGGKREKRKIYPHHEKWARQNGYRDNDNINSEMSERFVNYERFINVK